METSRCIKCNSSGFEMVEKSDIAHSKFKIMFIQCSGCGSVVGTMEYHHIGSKLKEIEDRLKSVESYAANIDENVVKVFNKVSKKK